MKIISFDVEVFYSSRLKYGLRNMLVDQFVKHELFDVYQVSVSDGIQSWAGAPKDFNWTSLEGAHIISHNARFDETCYLEMVERGLAPKLNIPKWSCSADLTSYLSNRRSLVQAVEYFYNVKLSKATRDDSNGRHFPADFSASQQEEMRAYGRSDALWCYRLWADHSAKWPEHEQRLSLMTRLQGRRGVQINTELLDTYLIQSHEMKIATEKLLPWLRDVESEDENSWEDFNTKPTSTKCVAEQCRRAGIPCPPVKANEGEEAYAEWELTYSPRNPWIPALSSWRSIQKLYKSFLTFKSRLRADGTMPFSLKYFGAHTGRFSGDGGINFQNFRKKPILCNELGLMETDEHRTGTDWIKYSIDPRHLIIPRPGKRMILSDLSQIEPRCLAYLAGDEKLLGLVRGGMSLYEAFARSTMGFTGAFDKKSVFYAECKARVLALGYGAGWEKYIEMTADYTGLDITANDPEFVTDADGKQVSGYGQRARKDVAEYRAQNPLVTGLWNKLDLAFKRCIGDKLEVVLPSGRKLRYEAVKAERRLKPDKDGKPRLATVYSCNIGGRRFETYGGKLTENLVQAFARDVFAEHLLRLADAGLTVLFSSHDEAILEVEPGVTASDVEAIMSECPSWCPGLPVAAEAHVVSHYLK